VIQKHRATALHYDLRLEWKGVMLSWAVPKGPSFDPAVKRMAMQVEDHPIEYNQFEGIIPAGEYGGGTVMIWDKGTWTPESPDVDASLAKGELKLTMEGKKLHGSWVMVRTRPRPGQSRAAWLLIKHRDAWASTGDVTASAPRSVISHRLLIEIARDEGGDMRKAADGDPPALLREILKDPALLTPPKKKGRKKSVWHSNRVA
jgi:bifunctional non-homologous end joining protein LigD